MTENVHNSYTITNSTLALVPSYRFDSSTLVYETNKDFYVEQPSLEMIKVACLDGFSNYDGRREAAVQTGTKRKVPIVIYPNQDIYAFPTHSPTHFDCHWLFYAHTQNFTSAKKQPRQSIVTYSNGYKLLLPVFTSVIEKQMYRTSLCILRCNQYWEQSKECPITLAFSRYNLPNPER